jgi:transcription-repair coupling factor (superfamily II helicase)
MKTVTPDLMRSLLEQAGESVTLAELVAVLGRGSGRCTVSGLAGSARAFVLAQLFLQLERPLLVVLPEQEGAEALRDDLEAILGPGRVPYLPEFETSPYDVRSPHLSILDARLSALSHLLLGPRGVLVTTARSLATQVVAPEVLRRGILALAEGDPMDTDDLSHWLADLGYRRVPMVEEQGDVARRGGIVDVFSFGSPNPVRIEFDGDEIASLREFDPTSQRSVGAIERVVLLPRREMVVDGATAAAGAAAIRAAADGEHDSELTASQLEHEHYTIGMRRVAGFLDQGWGPVARYFPSDLLPIFESPVRLADRAAAQVEEVAAAYEERRRHHELVSPPDVFVNDWAAAAGSLQAGPGIDLEPVRRSGALGDALRNLDISRSTLPPEVVALTGGDWTEAEAEAAELPGAPERPVGSPSGHAIRIRFDVRAQESFGREMELLRAFLRSQSEAGIRILVLCDNPGQRDHLEELIGEEAGAAEIVVGRLAGGFLWREIRLCVLTDHEIFGRFRRRRSRRRFRAGITLPDLMALKPGDYVVHVDHGIGVYHGTRRLTVGGHETDCIEIHYQRGDKLFIPADQFDLVQKYPIEEGHRSPAVSRLGGNAWARTKEKAKKAIQEMAEELLGLQAIRNTRPGFAYSPDTAWQRDMEAAFIYDETPDQERAITDIKRDMEAPRPMDRLVCGDVGYGKTEVAVRAAFKAIQDRKQVAVLVPTTILAQQHHGTFSERLTEFPVKIEVLSRFRTTAEQAEVVAGLKRGEVDIVIGTHRLLQKDVEFGDLGLIVIDEEHRFGVKDKERLKQLKAVADVLTLTATPIPRTLHLSLAGARDISLIATPPRDRVPIHTEISEFDRDLIADALLREADRGGQSFLVHNRVQSMDAMLGFLRRICPQLRFGVAHGQMAERHLEQVIVDFMDRKFDVLVTTMIIESGVDMPSVNTMVVNRADRFGLAQLYQLRGRVGRSNQRAHCFLLVPPHRALTEAAERRLRVIEDYDELGAGFKIAMKDMEIRGAGNLLGSQQHGHIMAVGFDLYCRLVEETISGLKGEAPVEKLETRVATELDAYLTDEYVGSAAEKITVYKRLADTREVAQVDALASELADRFGKLPPPATNLLMLRRIKLAAAELGISTVDVGKKRVRCDFAVSPSKASVQGLLARTRRRLEFVAGPPFSLTAREVGADPLAVALEILGALEEPAPVPGAGVSA